MKKSILYLYILLLFEDKHSSQNIHQESDKSTLQCLNLCPQVEPSKACVRAVQKMSSCPACQGLADVKPCNGFCINIMKGCMAYHYEIDELWSKYIGKTRNNLQPFKLEYKNCKKLAKLFVEKIIFFFETLGKQS